MTERPHQFRNSPEDIAKSVQTIIHAFLESMRLGSEKKQIHHFVKNKDISFVETAISHVGERLKILEDTKKNIPFSIKVNFRINRLRIVKRLLEAELQAKREEPK